MENIRRYKSQCGAGQLQGGEGKTHNSTQITVGGDMVPHYTAYMAKVLRFISLLFPLLFYDYTVILPSHNNKKYYITHEI